MKKTVLSFVLVSAFSSQIVFAQNKLEEVVVTSSRVEMPLRQVGASVSVMALEEIELRGYSSVTDLLRTLPGISATNSGGAGKATSLRIRGEEGYRTLVMIDGVEVSDPTGTQVMPQIQHISNSSEVERIEVLRGPQGFIYGADAGGVVNIFTRSSVEGVAGEIATEYGRYNTKKINAFASQGGEIGDVFVSISDQSTDGFNTRVEDVVGENDGYENTTFHSKFGWNFTENYRAQFVFRDVTSESEFDQCFGTDDCLSEFDQTIARISLTYSGDRSEQTIGYSQTDVERGSFTDGSPSFATEGTIQKADYLRGVSLWESYKLIYGADFEREEVLTSNENELDRDQLGVFGEVQADFDGDLYITGGLRYDDHDDFGEHISARFTTAYVVELASGSSLKFRGSLGAGFRSPSISEIAYNDGPFAFGEAADTVLTEETTEGIDVGVEFHGSNGFFTEITLFAQSIEDEIFFDLEQFSGYLQGEGTSDSQGVEIAFDYPVFAFMTIKGNLTYNDTEQRDDVIDNVQRIRRPEKFGNLGAKFSLVDGRLNILANIRVARDSSNEIFGIGRVELDDYEVIDLTANYQLSEKLAIFGRLENASDEDYQEITNYNTSGSALYAGFRYDF